ncbi:hypothetical protein BDR26DRAFT_855653, partial [Obelidium mucronatum]
MVPSVHPELQSQLLDELLEFRANVLSKTEKLINMLGGSAPIPQSGIVSVVASITNLIASSASIPGTSRKDISSPSTSVGNQFDIRWDGEDYAKEDTKNTVPVSLFDAKGKTSSSLNAASTSLAANITRGIKRTILKRNPSIAARFANIDSTIESGQSIYAYQVPTNGAPQYDHNNYSNASYLQNVPDTLKRPARGKSDAGNGGRGLTPNSVDDTDPTEEIPIIIPAYNKRFSLSVVPPSPTSTISPAIRLQKPHQQQPLSSSAPPWEKQNQRKTESISSDSTNSSLCVNTSQVSLNHDGTPPPSIAISPSPMSTKPRPSKMKLENAEVKSDHALEYHNSAKKPNHSRQTSRQVTETKKVIVSMATSRQPSTRQQQQQQQQPQTCGNPEQTPTAPPQKEVKRTASTVKKPVYFKSKFLIPKYDAKGLKIALEHFERSDLDAINFNVNGLHPKSRFSTFWDLCFSWVLVAALGVIPFLAGYNEVLETRYAMNVSIGLTVVFLLDSLFCSVTPLSGVTNVMCSLKEYENERPLLKDWVQVWMAKQFFWDLLSIIPFELFFMEHHSSAFFLIFKLIRVRQLPAIFTRCAVYIRARIYLENLLGKGAIDVLPLSFAILAYIHINACIIYYIGRRNEFLGWGQVWLTIDEASLWKFYVWTFFQATGNMFPMSFKPQTLNEQLFSIAFILMGAVLYAAFVGYLSSAFTSVNPSGRLYNQKMEELNDYVKWRNLSEETKQKLVQYYETKYRGKYFEEDTLLADMNESLRSEISMHNTRYLIEKVPFLKRDARDGRDEIFFNRIANKLHARYFIPGDCITKQGDSGLDMYFILSGKVDVFVHGVKVVSLYDGSYFGEVSLITKTLRTATCQAALPCVLYRLTYQDFHLVINEFTDIKERVELLALEREKMIS